MAQQPDIESRIAQWHSRYPSAQPEHIEINGEFPLTVLNYGDNFLALRAGTLQANASREMRLIHGHLAHTTLAVTIPNTFQDRGYKTCLQFCMSFTHGFINNAYEAMGVCEDISDAES